jgi:tRNA(Ile)-lysidine synthase
MPCLPIAMLERIKETIRKYTMITPGDRIVVAVSGGPDSVCLLSVLHVLSGKLNLSLHVAHLDHMFRGRQSEEEALFVADLAAKLGTPCTVEHIDVPAYCRERGLSAQAGAREVRYQFLSRVASGINASRIATGHTADDQAETFLLRLLRGAGLSGLSAIPPVRGNIIRPLIEATRESVLDHLREKDLPFVTDPSNAKPVYTRNRIRQEVIPVLKQFNPRIVETLSTEASLLRDEYEASERCLGENGVILEQGEAVLDRETFNGLPVAFKRRLIIKAAARAGINTKAMSSVEIDRALDFMATAQTGRSMQLREGFVLRRQYEKFVVRFPLKLPGFAHVLAVPGTTVIPEIGMQVEIAIGEGLNNPWEGAENAGQANKNYCWQAQFDYDKIRHPTFQVRNRRPGDRFCPAGMAGKTKKLQDYFVDTKIPREKRERVPLLVAGDDILWIIGFRTDERFQRSAGTRKIIAARVSDVSHEARRRENSL